jgi:hypothetical protein
MRTPDRSRSGKAQPAADLCSPGGRLPRRRRCWGCLLVGFVDSNIRAPRSIPPGRPNGSRVASAPSSCASIGSASLSCAHVGFASPSCTLVRFAPTSWWVISSVPVKQRAHVVGSRTISLADSVHVAARDREAAVAHPLSHCPGFRDGAELGRHEVPEPVQRVVVAEPAHQRREPLADRVWPQRGPTVRCPSEQVCLGVQLPVALRVARSGFDARGAARRERSWGLSRVYLRHRLLAVTTQPLMLTVAASTSRSTHRSAQTSDGRSPAVVLSRRNTAKSGSSVSAANSSRACCGLRTGRDLPLPPAGRAIRAGLNGIQRHRAAKPSAPDRIT